MYNMFIGTSLPFVRVVPFNFVHSTMYKVYGLFTHILGSHHVQDLADMFAWLQAEADGKVPFEDQPLAEMRIEMHWNAL